MEETRCREERGGGEGLKLRNCCADVGAIGVGPSSSVLCVHVHQKKAKNKHRLNRFYKKNPHDSCKKHRVNDWT